MYKAVKECLKNWLVTHERLYWYIVVGIAVFLFGLITAIGCGKMADAYASDNSEVRALIAQIPQDVRNEYEHCVIAKNESEYAISKNVYALLWNGSDSAVVRSGDSAIYVEGSAIDGKRFRYDESELVVRDFEGGIGGTTNESYYMPTILYSSVNVYGQSGVSHPPIADKTTLLYTADTYSFKDVVAYKYSKTAPYIGFDSLTIKNKLGTADIDYGLLGGTDLAQNTVNLDWLYEQGMDMSFWQYNGHVCNLMGFSPEGMQLHMAFTVELPTNEFITAYINKYNNGAKIDYREAMKNVIDSVADWLINDGPTKAYDIKYVFEPVVNADGTFSVSLTFQEIYDLLCYFNEDFLKLYGASTNENMNPYIRAILMSHLHIEQTNSLLYVPNNGTMYYGNPIINFYSRGIVNKAVTAKVEVDIRTATEEEISEAMKKAIEKGYDEALKDANDALGDAENELEGIYGVDGAFGELEGSDLWSGFKGLVTGFTGSIPAIQSLSLLIGSVFAFLPMQVSGIMSFTLLALCIIGIYKAIRG